MLKFFCVPLIVFVLLGCEGSATKSAPVSEGSGLASTAYQAIMPLIGKEPVLLEFGSTTCAACVRMGSILGRIKQEYPASTIFFVDVYADMPAANNYKIQMIPTQIYLDASANEIGRHVGEVDYETLVKHLKAQNIIKE